MPKMISRTRNINVQACGHAIRFPKGVEVLVPESVALACYKAGAEMVNTADTPPVNPLTEEVMDMTKVMTITERNDKLLAAVQKVLHDNNPAEFTASNAPKLAVVSTLAGFTVTSAELKQVMLKLQQDDFAAKAAAA